MESLTGHSDLWAYGSSHPEGLLYSTTQTEKSNQENLNVIDKDSLVGAECER